MNVGSLFSGIGGLDLGLERAGMHVAWQCEIDPFCRAILRKHWPDIPCYPDVRELVDAPAVDLICGGFPCQPVSLAGKGKAQADARWLWPEFARVVGLLRPRIVLVENVPGLVRRGLADVVGDLAAMGYDADWQIVSAAAVGAPHIRERVFVVALADANVERSQGAESKQERGRPGSADSRSDVADSEVEPVWAGLRADQPTPQWWGRFGHSSGAHDHWAAEPDVGRVADGVPGRLHRLTALGNAVVPQVAEAVGRMILAAG